MAIRNPTTFSVQFENGTWQVVCVDGKVERTEHETKDAAVWAARRAAGKHRPSRLIVYSKSGALETTFNYNTQP